MIFLADRVKRMKPSPTLSITAKAAALKAEGIDIISLSVGEPDFDTPDHVKAAGIAAIQKGKTKYTAVDGIADLKKAIQKKFFEENHLSYDLNQIIVGVGAKQLIFNAFLSTLNQGEEVIIPAPYWVSYPEMVEFAEGISVIISCDETSSFKLTPSLLEKAITPRTKWLILNSPSNPTGEIYSKDEFLELGKVLVRHPHVHVLSDDIYEHLRYEGGAFYTMAEVVPSLKERVLTINGVSKSHAMTGWRIGYAGGPKEIIQAMASVQSQSTSNPCSISQYAALEALSGDKELLVKNARLYKGRRDLMVDMLNAIPGLRCKKPGGAFYVFVNCSGLLGKKTPEGHVLLNDLDVTTYFLENARVAVVQGSAFGASPYIRISYATSDALLKEAANRLKEAILKLKDV